MTNPVGGDPIDWNAVMCDPDIPQLITLTDLQWDKFRTRIRHITAFHKGKYPAVAVDEVLLVVDYWLII